MATTNPGVQNPHCTPPASTIACWTSVSTSPPSAASPGSPPAGARPSTVVMAQPTAASASSRQAHTSTPSTSTEHDPHSPCSQAFLAPGSPSRSRRTCSRLSPARAPSTRRAVPLTTSSYGVPGPGPSPFAATRHAARLHARSSARRAIDLDGVAPVGRGRPVVVDRPGRGGHAAPEPLDHRRVRRRVALPVEPGRHPHLGVVVADGRRPGGPERARHPAALAVDHQGAARHRDDHGVAHADLEELPGPADQRHPHGHHQLVGPPGGLLGSDEEVAHRQRAAARRPPTPARRWRRVRRAPAACRPRASRSRGCRRRCRRCGSAGCRPSGRPGPAPAAGPPARARACRCR